MTFPQQPTCDTRRTSIAMGTLKGFPNPPATLRCQLSWQAPHARNGNPERTALPRVLAAPTFLAPLPVVSDGERLGEGQQGRTTNLVGCWSASSTLTRRASRVG